MNEINIMMCGNAGIFHGMLLSAISIAQHTKEKIKLFIGTADLRELDGRYLPVTEKMRETLSAVLREANAESEVILCDFTESFKRELYESKNLGSSYTPYAMIRLFADELCEVQDRLLYLDTDVMTLSDLAPLYSTELGECHLGGVRDRYGKFFFGINYLNSGVLLFNMKAMREDGVFRRCRELCRDKRMLLFDQHALNKYAKRKLILPRKYNEQKASRADTVIRHFSMTIKFFPYVRTRSIKPWNRGDVREILGEHRFEEVYKIYDNIAKCKDLFSISG